MRAPILEADSEMIEERKWTKTSNAMAGVPVWSHNGIVCTGETYTKVVKLTFARGASLPDPSRLFNSSLEDNTRRAIDIHEGEQVNAGAFKALVRTAVAQNGPPTPDERWLWRGSPNDQTQGRQAAVPRRRPRGRSFLSLLKNSRYEQAATIV